jgi:LCP family protein required for cell wall assembly
LDLSDLKGDVPLKDRVKPVKRKRQRHPVRTVLSVLGALLIAVLAFWLIVPLLAWGDVATLDVIPTGDRPGEQPGTAILLVGGDSRDDLTPEEQDRLGVGTAEGNRTDTMILLYIPDDGQPVMVSLPRDSYLTIPGSSRNKLNAAYPMGGPRLLVNTIEQNTGVRIDGYIQIGMAGFADLVDAVGGLDVCLDEPIQDKDSALDLPAGCQTLDGPNALGYVRMRYADPRGDLGRVERQREAIGKIADKVLSAATFLNPVRYKRVVDALARSASRSEDTSMGMVLSAMRAVLAIGQGNGLSLTVPISNPDASTPVGSAVVWNAKEAKALFSEIARGDTSQLERFK